jgi:3-phosphoshikimate 1-carboxyvinyltransferase
MHERPQGALFTALRDLGYLVSSPNDKLPAVISGSGPRPDATCHVRIEESSQFASALMLCAKHGGWDVKVVGENAEESPYVAMTSKLIEAFSNRGGKFQIEPVSFGGNLNSSRNYAIAMIRLSVFWLGVSQQQNEYSLETFTWFSKKP